MRTSSVPCPGSGSARVEGTELRGAGGQDATRATTRSLESHNPVSATHSRLRSGELVCRPMWNKGINLALASCWA